MARSEDIETLKKRIDELETENLQLREQLEANAAVSGKLVPDGTPLALGTISLGVPNGTENPEQVKYSRGDIVRGEHLAMLIEGQHYRRFDASQLSF